MVVVSELSLERLECDDTLYLIGDVEVAQEEEDNLIEWGGGGEKGCCAPHWRRPFPLIFLSSEKG